MGRGTIAVVSMDQDGHLQRMLPLIADLAADGERVVVFTDRRYRQKIAATGAGFVDLFEGRPLAGCDDSSIPYPVRFVSFAGRHSAAIARRLEGEEVDLVLYDTFALVGALAARLAGIPAVNVVAGHDMRPAEYEAAWREDPRFHVAEACLEAIEELDARGIEGITPFSFIHGRSEVLNVSCEPPGYLSPANRRRLDPVAFYGSLRADAPAPRAGTAPAEDDAWGAGPGNPRFRLYASLGTVGARYWPEVVQQALETTAAAAAQAGGKALVSTANSGLRVNAPGAEVREWVDQPRVLATADLFMTHNGLNSTHEAIASGTPMLSYPLFSDQPHQARHCENLGIALPLAAAPRAPLTTEGVIAVIESALAGREGLADALDGAREQERRVMLGRPAVRQRILALRR